MYIKNLLKLYENDKKKHFLRYLIYFDRGLFSSAFFQFLSGEFSSSPLDRESIATSVMTFFFGHSMLLP